jgi:hypothetical protein
MIEIVVKVEGNRKKLLKLLPLFVFTHFEYQVRIGAASRYCSGSTKGCNFVQVPPPQHCNLTKLPMVLV